MQCLLFIHKILHSLPFLLLFLYSEQTEAQRTVNKTVERYNNLGDRLTFRREELEANLNLDKLFAERLRSLRTQIDWVMNMEQLLDNQEPLSKDINTLEEQYNTMKVCGKSV